MTTTLLPLLFNTWAFAPPTPVFRTPNFWLSSSEESKLGVYVTDSLDENRHVLTLTFTMTGNPYTGTITGVERRVSVKLPHAFGWGDSGYVDSGFDPWLANVAPSGSWINGNYLTAPNSNEQIVKLAYHDVANSKLEGGTTFEAVYRWKGTVDGVLKTWVYHFGLKVYKVETDGDAPVDSRLAYGSQNDTWTTIDANGSPRNLNFNPWLFRGGLFVGNMSAQTRDRSGTARSQLWFPEPTEEDPDDFDNIQYAHASLVHLGFWPAPDSALGQTGNEPLEPWRSFDIGLWVPSTNSDTETTATWATRWGPTTTAGTGYLSKLTMPQWNTTMGRDYANWSLMTSLSSSQASVSTGGLRKFVLAPDNESDLLAGDGTARWRYFAGKEMGPEKHPGGNNDNLPVTDQKPRVWILCTRFGQVSEYVGTPESQSLRWK